MHFLSVLYDYLFNFAKFRWLQCQIFVANYDKITDMKKNGLKLFLLLALCLPLFYSCKQVSIDITDLISTVPSSANGVVGINLKSILEKSGCTVNGSEITAGKELEKLLSHQNGSNSEVVKMLFNGDSGIDPLGAVAFFDANKGFVTCMLADVNKFKAFVEKESGSVFEDKGKGVQICGNIAMKGPQAWLCFTSYTIDDPGLIDSYANMPEGSSYIQNPFSKEIATMTNDITGWVQLRTLLGQTVSFQDIAIVNMVSSVLFEDPVSIKFTVNFLKGRMNITASMLNDKGKPAKYLLPAEKIDVSTVEKVGESTDLLVAMTITPKLIESISRLGKAVAGNLYESMKEGLDHIDGTVAVAFSNPEEMSQNISGIVTTDGQTPLTLLQIISGIAPYRKDGKFILFSKGTMQGNLDVKEGAALLKGSAIGIVGSLETFRYTPVPSLKSLSVSLIPEGGSLHCNLVITSVNKDENILLSIIKDNPEGLF